MSVTLSRPIAWQTRSRTSKHLRARPRGFARSSAVRAKHTTVCSAGSLPSTLGTTYSDACRLAPCATVTTGPPPDLARPRSSDRVRHLRICPDAVPRWPLAIAGDGRGEAPTPWSGRRRHIHGYSRRRGVWIGAHSPRHHRPLSRWQAADDDRRWAMDGRVQRRDLQLSRDPG